MEKKVVTILVLTLFIAAAVLPAVGTMNEKIYQTNSKNLQPRVEWEKTYGGPEFDHFHSARQTSDGGYIACGITHKSNMYYAWVLKADANGNELWNKTNYDLNGTIFTNTNNNIFASDVIETSDSGFLIVGFSTIPYNYGGVTYWIYAGYFWKTDALGNTKWVKHYYNINISGLSALFAIYNVIEVKDGFVAGGFKEWYNATDYYDNGAIMKTDLSGNLLWENEFNKTKTDYLSSVNQTSDGGYFLGGYVEGPEYQGNDALRMVKTYANGTLQWDKIFDGPGFEYTFGKGFYQTSDGGYIMNGVTNSYGQKPGKTTDVWLIKIDSSGNEVWNKTYGGINNDYCWGMCSADDNGSALGICLNYNYISGNKDDIFIVETGENGLAEWELQIEEKGSQVTRSINPTKDGGYIVAAMTSPTFGNKNCDAMLVKIAPFDNGQPLKPTITGQSKGKPDKNYTFTASSSDPDGDSLSYMWNWGDGNYSEWLTTPTATHSWTTKDKFEIKVMVKDEHGGESEWSDSFIFSTPLNRAITFNSLLMKILEKFPLLERILNLQ